MDLGQPGDPRSARWTWVSQVNLGQSGGHGSVRWTWVNQVDLVSQVNMGQPGGHRQPGGPGSVRWTSVSQAWVSQVDMGQPGGHGSARWTWVSQVDLVSQLHLGFLPPVAPHENHGRELEEISITVLIPNFKSENVSRSTIGRCGLHLTYILKTTS